MSNPATDFYDALSPFYHDNMGWDWDSVMRHEGTLLSDFLDQQMSNGGLYAILDCACGIGTQAIGLALHGHRVHGTDLSPVSVDCARSLAERLGVDMTFEIADFRHLGETVSGRFDVVMACDNSIAHCLEDDDLVAAVASMKSRLLSEGLLVLSVRDYDALVEERPQFNNEHVQDRQDGRRVVFQVWDWDRDGSGYLMHQFLLRQTDTGYETNHFRTKLRALRRDQLIAALESAEYRDIGWHPPPETGYYQPIVTARP